MTNLKMKKLFTEIENGLQKLESFSDEKYVGENKFTQNIKEEVNTANERFESLEKILFK